MTYRWRLMNVGDFVTVITELANFWKFPKALDGLIFHILEIEGTHAKTPYLEFNPVSKTFENLWVDTRALCMYATKEEFSGFELEYLDLVDDVFDLDLGFVFDRKWKVFDPTIKNN